MRQNFESLCDAWVSLNKSFHRDRDRILILRNTAPLQRPRRVNCCVLCLMLPYDFFKIRDCGDKEAACHAVFDEAHSKWTVEGRGAINESQLTVMCVETFFGEVCNGGLDQYLFNESGRNASFGPAALRRVGLPNYAEILEEALARCTNTPEENEFGIMEDFFEPTESDDSDDDDDDPLGDLDDRYFELYFANKTEFRDKLFQYIVDNEDDFVAVP
jgi:hypothetical protein